MIDGKWIYTHMLGHRLRLPADCPATKAMRYYFEKESTKSLYEKEELQLSPQLTKTLKEQKKSTQISQLHH